MLKNGDKLAGGGIIIATAGDHYTVMHAEENRTFYSSCGADQATATPYKPFFTPSLPRAYASMVQRENPTDNGFAVAMVAACMLESNTNRTH